MSGGRPVPGGSPMSGGWPAFRGSHISGHCWDLSGPVLYFPVRHHSPVCSFHLLRAVEAYGPDCILVEGPQNARHLIPVLIHPETKPPVALYYSYQDKTGIVSPEKGTYKCYYPFLSCSPELAALKAAAERKVPADFIDLPTRRFWPRRGKTECAAGGGEADLQRRLSAGQKPVCLHALYADRHAGF